MFENEHVRNGLLSSCPKKEGSATAYDDIMLSVFLFWNDDLSLSFLQGFVRNFVSGYGSGRRPRTGNEADI